MKRRKYMAYTSCMERLVDESEEVGVYACSQGMFDAPEPTPNIIGGYIINEEDKEKGGDSDDEGHEDRIV